MKNYYHLIIKLLCISALLFLLIAQAFFAGPLHTSSHSWIPTFFKQASAIQNGVVFLIAGCSLILICTPYIKRIGIPSPKISRRITFMLLILLLLLSVPIKLYKLSQTPLGAYNDEIVKGMEAVKIINGGRFQPFYIANKEFLFFYLLVPFVHIFGPTIMALRLLPFLCGLMTVFFSWLLFDRLWGKAVAFVGAGFLAVGLWPGQSSHICERLNAVPMFTAGTLYFIFLAIQSKRLWTWIVAGLFMAGGMWTFPSFRLIPVGVMLFIIWSLITKQLSIKHHSFTIFLAFLIFLICLLAPFKWNPETALSAFYSRQGHDFKIIKTPEQLGKYARQLIISFTIDAREDMSFTSQTRALLWWPLGAFFLAGLIIVLIRLPHTSSVFVVLWLLSALTPALASEPFARRLTAAQPLVFGLTGLGSHVLFATVFPSFKRSPLKALAPAGLLVFLTGIVNFNYFKNEIAPNWIVANEDFRMVQAAIESFDRYDVFMDKIEEEAELPYRFLTYSQTHDFEYFQPYPPAFSIPFRFNPERDFIYLFRNIPVNTQMIPVLKALYPEGILTLHQTERTPRGYYSFFMTHEMLDARRGIHISVSIDETEKQQICEDVRTFSLNTFAFNPKDLLPSSIDCTQNWTINSIFLADELGCRDFLYRGPPNSLLYIDNQLVSPTNILDEGMLYSIFLTAEPHLITVTFNVSPEQIPTTVTLKIRRLSPVIHTENFSSWETIPANLLLQPPAPDELEKPIPVARADFQYKFSKSKQSFRPSTSGIYDIARIEALQDGRYIANCWHQRCMVILDKHADVISEWDANLLHDPDWQRRFDFDVAPDGTVYLTGDSRNTLIAASPDGDLFRTLSLPCMCRKIKIESSQTALVLCPHDLFRIALADGAILDKIHPEQITYDRIETLAIDNDGRIYLADNYQNVIHVLSVDGHYLHCFRIPGPLTDTFGLRFDANGYLYIPYFIQHYVACFSSDGILQTGEPDYACDPLNSNKTRHPRYVFFPDPDTMWITNADSIFIMKKAK